MNIVLNNSYIKVIKVLLENRADVIVVSSNR